MYKSIYNNTSSKVHNNSEYSIKHDGRFGKSAFIRCYVEMTGWNSLYKKNKCGGVGKKRWKWQAKKN